MYTYEKHNEKAIITSYNGNEEIVEIPTEINGFTVIAIDSLTFFGNETVKEISIPNGIEIKENAITFCPNLKKIILEGNHKINFFLENCNNAKIIVDNNETYTSIIDLFDISQVINTSIFEILETKDTITITGINEEYNQTVLEIPNYIHGKKVMYLAERLFEKKAFKEVILNDFITEISRACFVHSDVKKVSHMDNIKVIGAFAFAFTNTEIDVLLDNIEEIKEDAFFGNTGLTEIILDKNLKKIGKSAFSQSSLKTIDLSMTKISLSDKLFASSGLETIMLPKNTTKIPLECFSDCMNLKTISNIDKFVYLEDFAFRGCSKLKLNLNFENLKHIGKYSLKEVTIPTLVKLGKTIIQEASLMKTKGIEAIVFTDEYPLNYIPKYFLDASSVKTVQLNNNITEIGEESFPKEINLIK